jgi:hypothetical protein
MDPRIPLKIANGLYIAVGDLRWNFLQINVKSDGARRD